MQEARGSSPLSSTFPQVKVTLLSWKSLRRWLGLTATPYQRDKLDDLTALQVGAVRHAISRPTGGRKPAIQGSAIEPPEVDLSAGGSVLRSSCRS
jgi:hypothetical protein